MSASTAATMWNVRDHIPHDKFESEPEGAPPSASGSMLQRALRCASDTRYLKIGRGQIAVTPQVFCEAFGTTATAIVIADPNTMAAAGTSVSHALLEAGIECLPPVVIEDRELHAEWKFVEQLDAALAGHHAIPVVVGSGSLNDLVKLVAHRAKRRYMVVATAASMDGYTAFGASITKNGSKQTFECPAPLAVVADLDVIGRAPGAMNAAGYADLVAKITAGADWIIADALGVETIDATAWSLVQPSLRQWTSNAAGIGRGDAVAIGCLTEGLMMTGFAMQWSKSSRPASGAEHQFSHLWDMQHHTHSGIVPSHGFKVGVATVAVTKLYEQLFDLDLSQLDVAALVEQWPASADDAAAQARSHFDVVELADKADEETRAKYVSRETLRKHLQTIQTQWPTLKDRLREQLIPAVELEQMLTAAGAPTKPGQIGITPQRLKQSFRQAYHIRRRYTVLDLAVRTGVLDAALDRMFA